MLSKYQKIQVDQWLNDKMTIKDKRDHNKRECMKLQEMAKREQNERNYALMLDSIVKGKDLVKLQTTQINVLSLQNIVNKIGVEYTEILRYERASMKGGVL